MSKKNIVIEPDPILRKKSDPIEKVDQNLRKHTNFFFAARATAGYVNDFQSFHSQPPKADRSSARLPALEHFQRDNRLGLSKGQLRAHPIEPGNLHVKKYQLFFLPQFSISSGKRRVRGKVKKRTSFVKNKLRAPEPFSRADPRDNPKQSEHMSE